ncbi:MAG: thiamine diphosphokinase [Clostridia bacterium]|nr:thiamine diphosphokinase [Clostridia bacterium]
MKRCIIVGAGEFFPGCRIEKRPDDLLIAADGGYKYLKDLNLRPDLLVADFDSLTVSAPDDIPVMRFKSEKDDTDMGLSIAEGIRRGYTEFFIYGGTGGRADHTFANYQALVGLSRKGMRGYLFGDGWAAAAITDSSLSLRPMNSGTVSVFSVDNESRGVSIKGLKYTLDGVSLTNSFPLGVSNEFIGRSAHISVESGTLLIFSPIKSLPTV